MNEITNSGVIAKSVSKKTTGNWSQVKSHLAEFDRCGLLALLQDLYAASRDNQAFLHARLGLGTDVLRPYKATIARWLWPDPFKNQDASVSKAKHAISDYRKAIGQPAALVELMVFFCEQAAGFCNDVGYQDEGYFIGLLHMFDAALKQSSALTKDERDRYVARLDAVRHTSHNFGYGVGDDMDAMLAALGFEDD
jgi:hypothetical protein